MARPHGAEWRGWRGWRCFRLFSYAYRDREKAGKTATAPLFPGQSPKERHYRRLLGGVEGRKTTPMTPPKVTQLQPAITRDAAAIIAAIDRLTAAVNQLTHHTVTSGRDYDY
jgi:hypothetical protein